jgi:hypothetical protein
MEYEFKVNSFYDGSAVNIGKMVDFNCSFKNSLSLCMDFGIRLSDEKFYFSWFDKNYILGLFNLPENSDIFVNSNVFSGDGSSILEPCIFTKQAIEDYPQLNIFYQEFLSWYHEKIISYMVNSSGVAGILLGLSH